MKIAIFYNAKTNPKNKGHALKVAEILDEYRLHYFLNPAERYFSKIGLAIAVGGDGTVLYTANLLAKSKIPILGINFGHLGYLCQTDKDNIKTAVQKIITKDYTVEEKTRIQAEFEKRDNGMGRLEALNEISIGGINRTVSLEVHIKTPEKSIYSEIMGDGLIVATQTGSTAYNMNAGGPMLLTEALSLVANNAFFEMDSPVSTTKSIVVPSESVIHVTDLSHNIANLPFVIADGQEAVKISKGSTIIVKKSKNSNYFVKF